MIFADLSAILAKGHHFCQSRKRINLIWDDYVEMFKHLKFLAFAMCICKRH